MTGLILLTRLATALAFGLAAPAAILLSTYLIDGRAKDQEYQKLENELWTDLTRGASYDYIRGYLRAKQITAYFSEEDKRIRAVVPHFHIWWPLGSTSIEIEIGLDGQRRFNNLSVQRVHRSL